MGSPPQHPFQRHIFASWFSATTQLRARETDFVLCPKRTIYKLPTRAILGSEALSSKQELLALCLLQPKDKVARQQGGVEEENHNKIQRELKS